MWACCWLVGWWWLWPLKSVSCTRASLYAFCCSSAPNPHSELIASDRLSCLSYTIRRLENYLRLSIALSSNPSQSYGTIPAMWGHTALPATRLRSTRPTLTPVRQTGSWFTYPGGMGGWVDLGGWLCTRYCTATVDKRVLSKSLYHRRQCSIVLKPRSDRIDYTVVCFMMHDCSRKLRKQYQCELSVA